MLTEVSAHTGTLRTVGRALQDGVMMMLLLEGYNEKNAMTARLITDAKAILERTVGSP
jgi:hypothetical protein